MPQGINTPGVYELPRGDKTPVMATEVEGVPVEEGRGRGRGGDRNPPTTRATQEIGAGSGEEDMMRGPRTAAPLRPQQGMSTDEDSTGTQQQQSDGADGARPKNGMHSRREYDILAPEEPEGGPDNVGAQVRGAGHGATRGAADQEYTETATGDETGQ